MKQIFLLYSCDDWKMNSSYALVCASTSALKIKRAIIREIQDGNMEYDCLLEDVKSMVEEFKRDWDVKVRADINSKLKFGFLDYVYDGEIQ